MAGTSDTLAQAAEERAKLGIHELEISFGGELDLHKHFDNCPKNPGHKEFIPINLLHLYHLPACVCSQKTLAWIKHKAELTVKLSVNYVSPKRPRGCPLSDLAGQKVLSVGSGCVTDICLIEGKDTLPCPFVNCHEGHKQHHVYGYITIVTAAHVVFDDAESVNTTVEFFYDNTEDKSNVRTARGVKIGAANVDGDFCELLCVTHDQDLFDWIRHTFSDCEKCSFLVDINGQNEKFICALFQRFPCLERITVQGVSERLHVIIKMDDILHTAETLTLLLKNDMSKIANRIRTLLPVNNEFISVQKISSQKLQLHFGSRVLDISAVESNSQVRFFSDFELFIKQHKEQVLSIEFLLREVPVDVKHLNQFFRKSEIQQGMKRMEVYNTSNNILSVIIDEFNLYDNLGEKLYNTLPLSPEKNPDDGGLVIHISHPHGQSKQVTFGTQPACFTGHGFYKQLYTAPTCNGSSGGPVWMIPETGTLKDVYGVPHSGCYGNKLNKGCSWTLYPSSDQWTLQERNHQLSHGKLKKPNCCDLSSSVFNLSRIRCIDEYRRAKSSAKSRSSNWIPFLLCVVGVIIIVTPKLIL